MKILGPHGSYDLQLPVPASAPPDELLYAGEANGPVIYTEDLGGGKAPPPLEPTTSGGHQPPPSFGREGPARNLVAVEEVDLVALAAGSVLDTVPAMLDGQTLASGQSGGLNEGLVLGGSAGAGVRMIVPRGPYDPDDPEITGEFFRGPDGLIPDLSGPPPSHPTQRGRARDNPGGKGLKGPVNKPQSPQPLPGGGTITAVGGSGSNNINQAKGQFSFWVLGLEDILYGWLQYVNIKIEYLDPSGHWVEAEAKTSSDDGVGGPVVDDGDSGGNGSWYRFQGQAGNSSMMSDRPGVETGYGTEKEFAEAQLSAWRGRTTDTPDDARAMRITWQFDTYLIDWKARRVIAHYYTESVLIVDLDNEDDPIQMGPSNPQPAPMPRNTRVRR